MEMNDKPVLQINEHYEKVKLELQEALYLIKYLSKELVELKRAFKALERERTNDF
jgi:hypothetical protein